MACQIKKKHTHTHTIPHVLYILILALQCLLRSQEINIKGVIIQYFNSKLLNVEIHFSAVDVLAGGGSGLVA